MVLRAVLTNRRIVIKYLVTEIFRVLKSHLRHITILRFLFFSFTTHNIKLLIFFIFSVSQFIHQFQILFSTFQADLFINLFSILFFGGIMYSSITTGAVFGIQSYLIKVETDISPGLPMFTMVGFLGYEVKEAAERVRVALRSCGYQVPTARITVNLSPAGVPKRGIIIDLPVAVSILCSMGAVRHNSTSDILIVGELGLNGEIRRVRGVLPTVTEAKKHGKKVCIVPAANYAEAAEIEGVRILGVHMLHEVVQYLQLSEAERIVFEERLGEICVSAGGENKREAGWISRVDFAEVHGQKAAKRALEIAAAGFHNVYMEGPPGTGKTMMARCLPGILPVLSFEESMEVSVIYSASGRIPDGESIISVRPFIAPHYSVTETALIGGGGIPAPGAVSLAHRGVLFLDEMTEFGQRKLNLLRQPIEDHEITIIRKSGTAVFPSRFMLIGAANPCPCGYYPNLNKCSCTYEQIRKYQKRISGPIRDRFDISTLISPVDPGDFLDAETEERSEEIRRRVMMAAERQKERFAGRREEFNADMDAKTTESFCRLTSAVMRTYQSIFRRKELSARAFHRILRVSRTIADLDDCDEIREEHLLEALQLRMREGDRS